jgi:hypothetical protein
MVIKEGRKEGKIVGDKGGKEGRKEPPSTRGPSNQKRIVRST